MDENTEFRKELVALLNRNSIENGSNTPDFILAGYLTACLQAWNESVCARERWYGRSNSPISGELEVR
jgi:hypothetical protein